MTYFFRTFDLDIDIWNWMCATTEAGFISHLKLLDKYFGNSVQSRFLEYLAGLDLDDDSNSQTEVSPQPKLVYICSNLTFNSNIRYSELSRVKDGRLQSREAGVC